MRALVKTVYEQLYAIEVAAAQPADFIPISVNQSVAEELDEEFDEELDEDTNIEEAFTAEVSLLGIVALKTFTNDIVFIATGSNATAEQIVKNLGYSKTVLDLTAYASCTFVNPTIYDLPAIERLYVKETGHTFAEMERDFANLLRLANYFE